MNEYLSQIIALGGGGFSMEPDNLALDSYVLAQARRKRPRVCLLPTATGDSYRYIANFYTAFTRLDCQPTHLSLFERTPDLRALISKQDMPSKMGPRCISQAMNSCGW